VRESEDQVHALRNACLHAGYRVCEAEAGNAEHLYCVYHGWSYALSGLLTDPLLRPQMTDRSRFRLPRYPMRIERGLLLVDLTKVAPEAPEAGPCELGTLPDLGERTVSRRQTYKTTANWKRVRQFLWGSPGVVFGDGCDDVVELGPLSFVALRGGDAALVRLNPRFPGQSEIDVIEMANADAATRDADPLGEALAQQGDALAAAPLSRAFYDWYWPLMAPAAAA
jgi:nitrite reductase/ring-hydroxylating ferredoxin subunit